MGARQQRLRLSGSGGATLATVGGSKALSRGSWWSTPPPAPPHVRLQAVDERVAREGGAAGDGETPHHKHHGTDAVEGGNSASVAEDEEEGLGGVSGPQSDGDQ